MFSADPALNLRGAGGISVSHISSQTRRSIKRDAPLKLAVGVRVAKLDDKLISLDRADDELNRPAGGERPKTSQNQLKQTREGRRRQKLLAKVPGRTRTHRVGGSDAVVVAPFGKRQRQQPLLLEVLLGATGRSVSRTPTFLLLSAQGRTISWIRARLRAMTAKPPM